MIEVKDNAQVVKLTVMMTNLQRRVSNIEKVLSQPGPGPKLDPIPMITPLSSTAALMKEVTLYKEALITIRGLGSVCKEFATCKHEPCKDSAAACLVATEALEQGERVDPFMSDISNVFIGGE